MKKKTSFDKDKKNELINIDVIIPSYKGYIEIVTFISAIKFQKNIHVNNVVIPITLSEDNPDDLKLFEFCDKNNIKFFEVTQSYFSHSLTRQRAIKKYCSSDIVVILSQDVKLTNNMCFYNLVKDIHDKKCVYTFGRQLGPKRGIERYIREKNYPKESYYVTKDDIPKMQTMAFFASDAFSALDRNVFLKLGGFGETDVIINEDMLWSYIILEAGYSKKYCADAVVEHYHKYSLKELYRRYYKVGRFYQQTRIFNKYKNKSTGFKLAMYVLWHAMLHFDIVAIVKWPFDMSARFFGMKRGRHYY